jgi:hypothetical protein
MDLNREYLYIKKKESMYRPGQALRARLTDFKTVGT